jgi:hypothetical protein
MRIVVAVRIRRAVAKDATAVSVARVVIPKAPQDLRFAARWRGGHVAEGIRRVARLVAGIGLKKVNVGALSIGLAQGFVAREASTLWVRLRVADSLCGRVVLVQGTRFRETIVVVLHSVACKKTRKERGNNQMRCWHGAAERGEKKRTRSTLEE